MKKTCFILATITLIHCGGPQFSTPDWSYCDALDCSGATKIVNSENECYCLYVDECKDIHPQCPPGSRLDEDICDCVPFYGPSWTFETFSEVSPSSSDDA